MILNSICLEGWRCFASSTKVGPFTDGLNIICGANGSGKSTLMMALVRGLFDNHLVTGEHISALRPWGRALNPRVTLEFTHDGVRYRLLKQFLASPCAELCRLEGDKFVPLAESRAADEQARRLLAGEAPGKGVTDQRHWGLAQVLWATQGNLRITDLSAETRTTLQEALGGQIAGPGADVIEKRIAEAYAQFFTRTGKLKAGAAAPAVVRLEMELDGLQQRCEELRERLEDFEAASRRIENLRFKADATYREETELTEQLRQTRKQAELFKDLVGQQKLRRQEVANAEVRYKNLSDRIRDIVSCRNDIAATTRQLERLREDAPAQARLVEQCQQAAQEAKQSVERVRRGRGAVKEARDLANAANRYTAARKQLAMLRQQIGDIETAQEELVRLRAARQRILAPDAKTLATIKKTARTRDDARLQLDAAVITVTIEPDTALAIEIALGEHAGTRNLAPGRAHSIHGDPAVAFRIEGVGSFRASGPTGSVDELRDKWETAASAFQQLISGFGTDEVEELERLHQQAAGLDAQIRQEEMRLTTLLGGRQFDALLSDRAQADSGLQEMLVMHPDWEAAAPDPERLLREADDLERQFTDAIDRAEADSDRAQEALNRALGRQGEHEGEIKNALRRQGDLQRQLDSLSGDGLTDQQRDARLTEFAMERDAADGKLRVVEEKLAEFGDDPALSVTVLEGQLTAVRQEKTDAEKELNRQNGRLEEITADAPYSALAAAEEKLGRCRDELAREQLQIDAVRLLHDTLQEQKREVMHVVIGPVQTRANHLLQRIAGTRFQDIRFEESLLPSGVAPRSLGQAVSLDEISGGEREQLYFAVRLALASVAFGEERQLVVLDDVFTYTDTPRLARIAAILEETADRFQIIMLTCHPERYRGLPKATFFDMDKIAGTER